MTEIKIPEITGLEESKAEDIRNQFKPMLDKMVALESQYNAVIKLDPEDEFTQIAARELLNQYKEVRIGTDKIHKAQKAFYLAAGRYVDGWKNAQLFAGEGIEKKLKAIITFKEDKILAEQETLRIQRWQILQGYMQNEPLGLGVMDDTTFNLLLKGAIDAKKIQDQAEQDSKIQMQIEAKKMERFNDIKMMISLIPELAEIDVSVFGDEEWETFLQETVQSYKEKIQIGQEFAARQDETARMEALQIKDVGSGQPTANTYIRAWIRNFKAPVIYIPQSLSVSEEERIQIKEINDRFESFKVWADKLVTNKIVKI